MHLQNNEFTPPLYPDNTILIGEEVNPSALAEVPEGRLVGIVSVKGSSRFPHLSIFGTLVRDSCCHWSRRSTVNQLEA